MMWLPPLSVTIDSTLPKARRPYGFAAVEFEFLFLCIVGHHCISFEVHYMYNIKGRIINHPLYKHSLAAVRKTCLKRIFRNGGDRLKMNIRNIFGIYNLNEKGRQYRQDLTDHVGRMHKIRIPKPKTKRPKKIYGQREECTTDHRIQSLKMKIFFEFPIELLAVFFNASLLFFMSYSGGDLQFFQHLNTVAY